MAQPEVFQTHQKVDGLKPCKKKAIAYAKMIPHPFIVKTMEGDHEGKPGDYLMKGVEGELYVCDQIIFRKSYEFMLPTEDGEVGCCSGD